jgi:hypothetical protein
MSELEEHYWSYGGKYLGRFIRSGTASYHHESERIFEYGTIYGDVTCTRVPKKYSWEQIIKAAQVNAKTIAYFTPIYTGLLHSHSDFLEIIEEMRDEQRHKEQLDTNQQHMANLDDSFKPVIQEILKKT